MSELITPELVTLDQDLGTERAEVIRHLVRNVVSGGRATSFDELYSDAMAREAKTATGVPGGIAIPHCRSSAVTQATLAMARINPPVDWGAKDGPADIVFFIAAPEGADQEHLQLLAKLARSLIKKNFTGALRTAQSPQEIVNLVDGALGLGPVPESQAGTSSGAAGVTGASAAGASAAAGGTGGAHPAGGPESGVAAGGGGNGRGSEAADQAGGQAAGGTIRRLVAVTACPTGIAHTYMAADSLAAAAAERGIDLQVETQGSAGSTPLDSSVIRNADAVIFATDVDVRDKGRFAGLPLVSGPVKRGIDEPGVMIDEAIAAAQDPNSRKVAGGGDGGEERASQGGEGEGFGSQIKRALLTGVSYMIPFVAGGGLLIALGFLLGGYELSLANDDDVLTGDVILDGNTLFSPGPEGLLGYLGAVFWKIGNLSLGFLVPALAGYIAYALADRPGIAPGFTAGAVALFMDAGFIGGLIGGLLAGFVAKWVGSWGVPTWLRGLMPVVIIPLITSLIASGLMILVLGGPIAGLTLALNDWLSGLSGAAAIVLGIVLGLMMGSDLGGPINKVAYAFAVAGLGEGSFENQAPWQIMAAVMAAGMVPPLAMALATVVDKQQFSMALRENGKAAWLLGAAFISEGAIPFAAADPFRVIPSSMVGGAVAGAICMAAGVTSQAPHGGIFVFFAIGNVLMFIVAILAGMVAGGLMYVALKRLTTSKKTEEPVVA
ncbi:fructose-specific PTS transporter subunit EIIC [Arthrobacter sp. zg-Y1219]|uniref:PTS fructose transporter subunit IIABC n=1 Tax=Arthrobacter sp. zg-Y1219 TaxID=3049067 RepID=UPI0024C3C7FB|nr:fructose-specific PTS transporter subunit EIIC [Arthrobacter sp. zg-Y1219]MDK1360507.1 fructose-specific PTS transporter subunit EIIC [Arthrobacter sp. zg-Y1219]